MWVCSCVTESKAVTLCVVSYVGKLAFGGKKNKKTSVMSKISPKFYVDCYS